MGSTTWGGPCKIIAPKFDEFSEQYKNVAFLKVMGDSSPEADKLMRSQGVRALPSFHFWKGSKQVDGISGLGRTNEAFSQTRHAHGPAAGSRRPQPWRSAGLALGLACLRSYGAGLVLIA